jgi:hypothetical protein
VKRAGRWMRRLLTSEWPPMVMNPIPPGEDCYFCREKGTHHWEYMVWGHKGQTTVSPISIEFKNTYGNSLRYTLHACDRCYGEHDGKIRKYGVFIAIPLNIIIVAAILLIVLSKPKPDVAGMTILLVLFSFISWAASFGLAILRFNSCDGILSKRAGRKHSSMSKMPSYKVKRLKYWKSG